MIQTHEIKSPEAFREAFVAATPPNVFARMAEEELGRLQVTPLSYYWEDEWEFPTYWMPSGQLQMKNSRVIRFADALPERYNGDPAQIISALKKVVFALLMFARLTKTGIKQSKPSSTVGYAKCLIRLAREALKRHPAPDGETLFSHLTDGRIRELLAGKDKNTLSLVAFMRGYWARGLLLDVPLDTANVPQIKQTERPRRNQDPPEQSQEEGEPWQPFPDEFVTEVGWRSLWLMNTLGPTLLDFWERYGENLDRSLSKNPRIIEMRRKQILEHEWKAPNGTEIDRLPFKIILRENGQQSVETDAWPPRNYSGIRKALALLQMAHFTLIAAPTGARWSEHSGATIGSVERLPDGSGRGCSRTWKAEEDHTGAEREWPLPPETVKAVAQQERMAKLFHPSNGNNHLWVALVARGDQQLGRPLHRINEVYEDFVQCLGLEAMLGGIRPHSHRWRKTIARLAAMALLGAPKILMDLFGHSQIEITLRYILTNPDIAAEIQEASKAYLHAMGKETAAESVSGTLTGKGSRRVEATVVMFQPRTAEDAFGTSSLDDVAEILAENGRSFVMIRPGIVCLKNPGETGPCSKTCAIDAARCSSDCPFRTASNLAKFEAEASVKVLIARLEGPSLADRPIAAHAFRGQLEAHLAAWPSLRDKWRDNPVVASLGSNAA